MTILTRVAATIRYYKGARRYLRQPLTEQRAREMMTQQLAGRESTFLRLVENAIYARPASPYLKLLQHAGIDLPQLQSLVQESGVEGALERLYDAGVYVTQDEFKSRTPIRRGNLEFTTRPSDFNNPLVPPSALEASSSGTTGAPIRVGVHLDDAEYRAAQIRVGRQIPPGTPFAIWDEHIARVLLWYAKAALPPEKVFTTIGLQRSWEGFNEGVLLAATLLAARQMGQPMPWPRVVTKDKLLAIAQWLAEKTAEGRPAAIACHVSPAVRICIAARERGLDISGTSFHFGGEPYTEAKAQIIEGAGARGILSYAMSESGVVGYGCKTPTEIDDLHLLSDKVALVQRPHTTPAGETVGALAYSTILPSMPKLLFNTLSGDYATVQKRECGCLLGEIGLNTHLHGVRSYEKLTAEGVTFVSSKLYGLLEDTLPARFGGHVNDYQLVEEEAESGIPRLSIVVAPRVGDIDESGVIAAVLNVLDQSHLTGGGPVMAAQWRQGQTLRVVRREPESGRNSKILPLRALPRTSAPTLR